MEKRISRSIGFALAGLIFFTVQNSYAAKEWKATTVTDPQGKICVASTSAVQGKSTYTLQVRVREGLTTPTELLLSRVGPQLATKGFQARVGSNGPLVQFSSLEVQGTTEFYYGLPHGTLGI